MIEFFRSRRWVVTRRLVLLFIALVVGYHSYGGYISSWLSSANPERDIVITRAEFRPASAEVKPAWIIGLRNNSVRYTYHRIRVEATYMDDAGTVLETDRLVIDERIPPGNEKIVGSLDAKPRGAATKGTLRLMGAEQVN
ncbi:MAG: hypothetical protein HY646_07150 [Acidobacteria bacterium]|nr:hypothetical protein [Acidobacteriota bacterium]